MDEEIQTEPTEEEISAQAIAEAKHAKLVIERRAKLSAIRARIKAAKEAMAELKKGTEQ